VIKNERQYEITRTQALKFDEALGSLRQHLDEGDDNTRALRRIQEAGMMSMLATLNEELTEYEALRAGTIRSLHLESLDDVPQALIKARIAAGLTQEELADRLGLTPEQVERDEATGYAATSFARIVETASALGLKLGSDIALPGPSDRAA
jgi:ribosome-binding protein aMBF1 (putative translation factor)